MQFHVFPTAEPAARTLAREIGALIRRRESEGRKPVIGFATGRTPLPLYHELIRMHHEEGLSFRNVIAFNLDEYHGVGGDDPQSYRRFMRERLFSHLDILPEHTHIPRGDVPEEEAGRICGEYEEKIAAAGGIDLQILGIGRTGHIGFNEPGSGRHSRTRLVALDPKTREDAAADFGGLAGVPRKALTMGCATILEARAIALMAWREGKAEIVERSFFGPVSDEVPASFLQEHPCVSVYLDEAAAGRLTTVQREERPTL